MEYSIRELQLKQLELLHELDRVCKAAGIKYYLAAGTCLGALRHNGFIPWDDDVDVFMHWQELDKLLKNKDLFKGKYFLQCMETEPNVNTILCRLRDSETTCVTEEDEGININHGVFIDIYILYPYPDNPIYAQKVIYDSFILRILQAEEGPRNHGRFAKLLGKLVANCYNNDERKRRRKQKIIDRLKENGGKKYYSIYFGEDVKPFWTRKYPVEWFNEATLLEFEDMVAPCPSEVVDYCKFRYGDTCMELPAKEKRVTNHDFIFVDLESSYLDYGL